MNREMFILLGVTFVSLLLLAAIYKSESSKQVIRGPIRKFLKDLGKNIAFGLIVSVIFYLIIVAYPRAFDRITIRPYIKSQEKVIVNSARDLRQSIYGASKQYPKNRSKYLEESFPEKDELEEMLQKIPRYSSAPAIYIQDTGFTWPDYIELQKIRTDEAIQRILQHSQHLPVGYVASITEIGDCPLFKFNRTEKMIFDSSVNSGVKIKPDNIALFRNKIFDYLEKVKEFEREFVPYKMGPGDRKYESTHPYID